MKIKRKIKKLSPDVPGTVMCEVTVHGRTLHITISNPEFRAAIASAGLLLEASA